MPPLSRRESEVAQLVAEGLTNRQIAERLFVSERTAEYHLEQIRNKLGLHSRAEIAGWLATQAGAGPPPPSKLPPRLTTFIGRAREIAGVRSLLEQTRIVTITGAGGAGKTRLALELADRVAGAYSDGACFVDLQGLADPQLVSGQAAAALEVKDLGRELSGRRQLVVLDNCEQVVAAAAQLAQDLAQASEGIRVLATSRQPLHVAGEGVWPLTPLPRADAVDLFVARARLAAPDVDLAAAEPALVESICAELDGIPLAIELAAAQARVMSLADIHDRLRDRFRLLTGGPAATERQRTLEATIDWSYGLLSDAEKLLFRRLGVFAGSFFLDSAEAVAGDAHLIGRLVDQSMVIAERAPDRPTRYRLLVTLREYARDRLRESGELEELRARHARRYRQLADEAGAALQGPAQGTWLLRLEDELDEIRAASEWALDADAETALALAGELTWFWGLRGRVSEGRRALAAALPRAPARTVLRGRALIASGWLARLQGDYEAGVAFHAESVEVLREFDDPVELGTALVWDAEAQWSAGDGEAARRGWEEAVDLLVGLGPSQPLAYALLELALSDVQRGEGEGARQYAARAMSMNSQLRNPRALALCHMAMGYAEHLLGDSSGGLAEVQQCIRGLRDTAAFGDQVWPFQAASKMIIATGGSAHRAVTLAAAAEMVSQATGRRDSPISKDALDAALLSARTELGADAYEEAWQKGLAMTVDEAIAYALDS